MTPTIGPNGMIYPASYSVLSAPQLLADVTADYDVGPPLECRLWRSGVTDTYLVTTDRDHYILRVYRAGWRTDDDVAYELDALNHLKHQGVPVATPIMRKDGTWFHVIQAAEGVRQSVLFSYAPGREAYEDDDYPRRFGRNVATIHKVMDAFSSSHARFQLDLHELLDKALTAIQPVVAHRPDDWNYLVRLAEHLRERIINLPSSQLDWGFCHGDCHGADAHLDGNTLTLFDFDCCGPGWRAYDLATFRWIWAWHNQQAAPERWAQFLHGYREQRPLNHVDLAAVPLFVAVREIWLVGLHVRTAPIHGYFMVSNATLDVRLKFLREWEQRELRDLPRNEDVYGG